MEEEIILNRPSDRRLACDDNNLPPGPPGAENDTFELVRNDTKPKEASNDSRPRSPSKSRDRRSRSKSRRRSRSRGRNYSPPSRRRYGGNNRSGRRSPDRNRRSPDRTRHRSRDRRRNRRDRSRSRGRYRRRSRSSSPRSRHWSPDMKKPASPPPLSPVLAMNQAPAYSVPPPTAYADGYGAYPSQYARAQFPGYEYAAPVPTAPQFANAYPPPQATVLAQPIPPGDDFTWMHGAAVAPPAVTETLPPTMHQQVPPENDEHKLKRDAAVAQEVQIQREELKKQRDEYQKRAAALKRELKMLKEQRNDLLSVPTSPTTKGFLKENDRLQSQIQHKLLTMENVIDMLCGIIGGDSPSSPKKNKKKKSETENDDSSPERLKSKLIESMKNKSSKKDAAKPSSPKVKSNEELSIRAEESSRHVNYVFYDHEMHWCTTCNVFPKTAKDYLNHLHSKDHAEKLETPEIPWHDDMVSDEMPTHPNAPTKRTPIRGLQFFVPSTCWYCKLCKVWMGDLHCASAHLKSQKHSDKYNHFTEQNPHFEVDWMADRQRAYDSLREKDILPPPPPQITSVSTTGIDLLEGIPLQINQKSIDSDDKKAKRKKKRSEEKKDKKKRRKRSKRRKKLSSSSSSSSSESSSESESEKEKKAAPVVCPKEDRSNSIRVAMRNMLKTQPKDVKESPKEEIDNRNKMTAVGGPDERGQAPLPPVPAPPTIKNDTEQRKREDMMILQWNTPQPIISESEKKLLEELKGKLKNKPASENVLKNDIQKEPTSQAKSDKITSKSGTKRRDPSPKPYDNKEKTRRTRSRSRNRRSVTPIRNRGGRRSRSPVRSRSRDRRSRSCDRSRGRMSPIRRRRRSRTRSPRRRSRSPSRSRRRRSYSRSRSRSRSHRIEKPIVRYPEFRPRVPENQRENKKNNKGKGDEENERKKSPSSKKIQPPPSGQQGKKLPFIGRMPVFKKQSQGGDSEKKEGEMGEDGMVDAMHMGYDQYDSMNAMMDYEDLMPDPMQFVSLMGAPPPPPSAPPPITRDDDKDILPPGIDETEADLVPKPISDAPIPRKGPLPRDFEEALNIIFPGEKKPDADRESKAQNSTEPRPAPPPIPAENRSPAEMPPLPPEEVSQQSADFISFATVPVDRSSTADGLEISGVPAVAACPPPPPPPEEEPKKAKSPAANENESDKPEKPTSPVPLKTDPRKEMLDDLAMLGIDADDLAAQCI